MLDQFFVSLHPIFTYADVFLFSALVFAFSFYRLSLMALFYQQEEYDSKRFIPVVLDGLKLVDKRFSTVLAIVATLFAFVSEFHSYAYLILCVLLFTFINIDRFFLKQSKKQLVYTARVRRIISGGFLLNAVGLSVILAFALNLTLNVDLVLIWGLIALVQLQPLFLMTSNMILKPYESYVQKRYYDEAYKKLRDLDPTIIAMTGSYGKTSVKHILSHILSSVRPTLATPGSVNTVMGITRIIREKLEAKHQFFLCEMGAYGVGSIERLCKLCPPDHGILTAVGNAHYERFKSVETVAQAKFELFSAVKERHGLFVVNLDQVDAKFVKNYAGEYGQNLIKIASKPEFKGVADFYIDSQKQTAEGLQIDLHFYGQELRLNVPLYGMHHVNNIVVCFAMAHSLGIPVATIKAALRTTPQIKHRLEVKREERGADIIDDAYNANPDGFKSALKVANVLKKDKGGKAILVTPGMVELGDLHDLKHEEIAQEAADNVDDIIIIGEERIESFTKVLRRLEKPYKSFERFIDAKQYLNEIANDNDVILYANDLPDLYESTITL